MENEKDGKGLSRIVVLMADELNTAKDRLRELEHDLTKSGEALSSANRRVRRLEDELSQERDRNAILEAQCRAEYERVAAMEPIMKAMTTEIQDLKNANEKLRQKLGIDKLKKEEPHSPSIHTIGYEALSEDALPVAALDNVHNSALFSEKSLDRRVPESPSGIDAHDYEAHQSFLRELEMQAAETQQLRDELSRSRQKYRTKKETCKQLKQMCSELETKINELTDMNLVVGQQRNRLHLPDLPDTSEMERLKSESTKYKEKYRRIKQEKRLVQESVNQNLAQGNSIFEEADISATTGTQRRAQAVQIKTEILSYASQSMSTVQKTELRSSASLPVEVSDTLMANELNTEREADIERSDDTFTGPTILSRAPFDGTNLFEQIGSGKVPGLESGDAELDSCAHNFLYFPERMRWFGLHAVAFGPLHRFDPEENHWIECPDTLGPIEESRELFYCEDGSIIYGGTYICKSTRDVFPEGVILPKDISEAVIVTACRPAPGHAIPGYHVLSKLYRDGVLRLECVILQFVGFNQQLRDALQRLRGDPRKRYPTEYLDYRPPKKVKIGTSEDQDSIPVTKPFGKGKDKKEKNARARKGAGR